MLMFFKIYFYRLFYQASLILRISNAETIVVYGNAKVGFVHDCEEICKLNQLREGIIYIKKAAYGNVLYCSREISNEVRQQFRNVWGFYS